MKKNVRKGNNNLIKTTTSVLNIENVRFFSTLGKLSNFETKSDDDTTRNFEYDFESIMHYGPYFFR